MAPTKATLSVSIPVELRSRVAAHAATLGVNMSVATEQLLSRALEVYARPEAVEPVTYAYPQDTTAPRTGTVVYPPALAAPNRGNFIAI
jgi:hypothetical protein